MTNGESLLVFDLASYGSALAIINQFCDDQQVKVFEVSPVGTAAVLILLIKEKMAAQLLKNEILSFYKANILSSADLENVDPRLLSVYLSQNKPEVLSCLMIQEFSFVSEAFAAAQKLLLQGLMLVDFRIVRTFPMNVILTITSSRAEVLVQAKKEISSRSNTIIENVEATLKSYFQIVKS